MTSRQHAPDFAHETSPSDQPERSERASAAMGSGVSPADRNRAISMLAERQPLLLAMRDHELVTPAVSAERALLLSAFVQTLARDLAGPYPFQSDYFAEVEALAEGGLLDGALTYLAAEDALESTWTEQDRDRKAVLRERVGEHLRYLAHFGHAPGPGRDDHLTRSTIDRPIAELDDTADGARWSLLSAGAASFDDPHDLLGLVDLMIENPTDFGPRAVVSRERLDEARADALELIRFLERYELPTPPSGEALDADQLARDLLRRAYTAWASDYDRVVRVGRFYAQAPRTWPAVSNEQRVVLLP